MKRKNFEIVIRADGQIDLDLLNGDGKSCERDIDDLCDAALRWLRQTSRLDRSNKTEYGEWKHIARKINRNRIAILSMSAVLPLFQRAISGEALEVRRIGKRMTAAGEGPERERLEQERMVRFFGAYQKAAAHLRTQLDLMLQEAPR